MMREKFNRKASVAGYLMLPANYLMDSRPALFIGPNDSMVSACMDEAVRCRKVYVRVVSGFS